MSVILKIRPKAKDALNILCFRYGLSLIEASNIAIIGALFHSEAEFRKIMDMVSLTELMSTDNLTARLKKVMEVTDDPETIEFFNKITTIADLLNKG